jgi:hypothetical protein
MSNILSKETQALRELLSNSNLVEQDDEFHSKLKLRKKYNSALEFKQSLAKDNLCKEIHEDNKGHFDWLSPSEIKPLDSQRITDSNWVEERLKAKGGLDWKYFGTIQLVWVEEDQQHYVWDGCGRLAMAQAVGAIQVPCMIKEGSKKDAAEMFFYNQKEGARTVDPDTHAVQKCFSGFGDDIINQLTHTGLSLSGNTELVYPENSTDPSIKINALTKSVRIAGGNAYLNIIKDARDIIVNAYPNDNIVRAELLCGFTLLLKLYPDARKNGLHTRITEFLVGEANPTTGRSQSKLPYKKDGGNLHNNEAASVAYGFIKNFCNSNIATVSDKQKLRYKVIENYIG